MMKTKEELNILKQEYESLNNKLQELNEEELKQVTGGLDYKITFRPYGGFFSVADINESTNASKIRTATLLTYQTDRYVESSEKEENGIQQ